MQRTTIRLDEHLMIRVKEYAVQRRKSVTAVIEEALRVHIAVRESATPRKKPRVRLPVSRSKGGFAPGIDTWADVKRVREMEEIENFRRITREDAARRR
jgi:hypothetical protein